MLKKSRIFRARTIDQKKKKNLINIVPRIIISSKIQTIFLFEFFSYSCVISTMQ